MGHWTSIMQRTARRWHNTFFPCYSYSGKYTHWEIRFGRSLNSPSRDLQQQSVFFLFLLKFKINCSQQMLMWSILQIWPYPLVCSDVTGADKKISPLYPKMRNGSNVISSLTSSYQRQWIGMPAVQILWRLRSGMNFETWHLFSFDFYRITLAEILKRKLK